MSLKRWGLWAALCMTVACGSKQDRKDAAGTDGGSAEPDASEPDGSAPPVADGGLPDAEVLGHEESLDALGVDLDLPAYPDGLPEGYHPMRRTYTTLDQRDEILLFKRATASVRVYDDSLDAAAAPPLTSTPDLGSAGWMAAEQEAALAADVDGDGEDEVVVFYYEQDTTSLFLYVIDRGADGSFVVGAPHAIASELTRLPASDWFEDGVKAAQLDEDPAVELLLGFGTLIILDDGDESGDKFARLAPVWMGTQTPIDADRIDFGVGDLDGLPGDPTDEFVVTHNTGPTASIEIFDGLSQVATRTGSFLLNGAENHTSSELRVEVGNFDGRDTEDEILFFGARTEYDGIWVLTLMGGKADDYGWYQYFSRYIGDVADGRVSIQLRKLDINGDRVHEAFVDHYVIGNFGTLPLPGNTEPADASGPNLRVLEAAIQIYESGFPVPGSGRVKVTSIGNVVQTRPAAEGQTRAPVEDEVVGFDHYGRMVYGGLVGDAWVWRRMDGAGGPNDTLVLGNFDGDSAVVRYRNEHELLFSSPKPLALLSAPPFHGAGSGVEQSLGNCYTAFGKASGMEVSQTESMNFSVGWSLGFEGGIAGLAKTESTLSFEQKFDSTTSAGLEASEWITYATGAEDSVVFTAIPFDVYYYDIVRSPVPADVGLVISVNIPRAAQTSLVSAAFYDRHRGATPAIAPLFTHTVGKPDSYPGEADFRAACANDPSCYASPSAPVGEGGGFTELYVSKTTNESETSDYEFQVTAESKLTVAGVSFGSSVGFGYGFGMTIKTYETTAFTGRVSNIVGRTPATSYVFGLFARQVSLGEANSKVLLVDYWVK